MPDICLESYLCPRCFSEIRARSRVDSPAPSSTCFKAAIISASLCLLRDMLIPLSFDEIIINFVRNQGSRSTPSADECGLHTWLAPPRSTEDYRVAGQRSLLCVLRADRGTRTQSIPSLVQKMLLYVVNFRLLPAIPICETGTSHSR